MGLTECLNRNEISLGMIQRALMSLTDCVSAIHNFLFVLIVYATFKKSHLYEFYSIYLFLYTWLIAEAIGTYSTLYQRITSYCRGPTISSTDTEKMLSNKLFACFHYVLITVGTAGFVASYKYGTPIDQGVNVKDDESFSLFYEIYLTLFVSYNGYLIILITVLCMLFSVVWGSDIGNQKSLMDCAKVTEGFVNALDTILPCLSLLWILLKMSVLPIINQILKVLVCPFYYTNYKFTAGFKKLLYIIPMILLNFITIPIRIGAFFIALILQLIGWIVFVGTLGSPYCLSYCVAGDSLTKEILMFRAQLWNNHPFRMIPSIIPLVLYIYVLGPLLFLLNCLCFDDKFYGSAWSIYTRICFDTITGSRHGLGFRFDAFIVGFFMLFIMTFGLIFVSFWLLKLSEPFTLINVCDSILSTNTTKYWILFKIFQLALSIIYPLIRLYAYGLLYKFNHLFNDYFSVITYRQMFDILDFFLKVIQDEINKWKPTDNKNDNAELEKIKKVLNEIKEYVTTIKNLLEKIEINMKEELDAIAFILYDYDFKQSVIPKVIEKDIETTTNDVVDDH